MASRGPYRRHNTFFAAFIGSPAMSLIAGTASGGEVHFAGGAAVSPAQAMAWRPAEGAAVTAGIRPEDFSISVPGTAGVIQAAVKVAEFTDADT